MDWQEHKEIRLLEDMVLRKTLAWNYYFPDLMLLTVDEQRPFDYILRGKETGKQKKKHIFWNLCYERRRSCLFVCAEMTYNWLDYNCLCSVKALLLHSLVNTPDPRLPQPSHERKTNSTPGPCIRHVGWSSVDQGWYYWNHSGVSLPNLKNTAINKNILIYSTEYSL